MRMARGARGCDREIGSGMASVGEVHLGGSVPRFSPFILLLTLILLDEHDDDDAGSNGPLAPFVCIVRTLCRRRARRQQAPCDALSDVGPVPCLCVLFV